MYADAHTQVQMFADQCKFFSYFPCASCYVFRPWVSLSANPCPTLVAFQDPEVQLALDQLFFNPPTTTTNNNLNTKYKMLVLMHKYYTLFFSDHTTGIQTFCYTNDSWVKESTASTLYHPPPCLHTTMMLTVNEGFLLPVSVWACVLVYSEVTYLFLYSRCQCQSVGRLSM